MHNLGKLIYRTGRHAEGEQRHTRAANAGIIKSMEYLRAELYLVGRREEAQYWWRRAEAAKRASWDRS